MSRMEHIGNDSGEALAGALLAIAGICNALGSV